MSETPEIPREQFVEPDHPLLARLTGRVHDRWPDPEPEPADDDQVHDGTTRTIDGPF